MDNKGLLREPVLPLLYRQRIWHAGWDIETVWVVDAEGNVLESDAHGSEPKYQTTYAALLTDREREAYAIAKDIKAIKAIERKVKERLHNGKAKA